MATTVFRKLSKRRLSLTLHGRNKAVAEQNETRSERGRCDGKESDSDSSCNADSRAHDDYDDDEPVGM